MVNFGLNSASLLGIILAVAGAGLYFLRSVRPELSRDQDIAFTAIGIICGFILIFQGWRLDPILQFGQLLLSGSAIYFAYESIKMRGIANEQAKEKNPIVDERPVSRRYKAEIEDREYLDDRPRNSRRIRGDVGETARTENRRSNRRDEEDSEDLPRRRSNTRQLAEDRVTTAAPRRRRTEPARTEVSSLARRPNDSWDDENDWNESDAPIQIRRALPDAGRAARNDNLDSSQSDRQSNRRSRDERPDATETRRDFDTADDAPFERRSQPDPTPRRRRPRPDRPETTSAGAGEGSGSTEGTTANYVDYEPIDPPSGLPPSSSEPIVFPDRY
jgi:Ycf66 protein N-terminus